MYKIHLSNNSDSFLFRENCSKMQLEQTNSKVKEDNLLYIRDGSEIRPSSKNSGMPSPASKQKATAGVSHGMEAEILLQIAKCKDDA